MKLRKTGKFILLFLLIYTPCFAQVKAWVSKTVVEMGEEVLLNIEAESVRAVPEIKEIPDFEIISSSTSSQVRIINGRIQTSGRFTYTLIPKRAGTLTIPSIPVSVGNQTFHTQPITISVVEKREISGEKPPVFLKSEINPVRGYAGQLFIYKLRLYSRVPLRNAALREMNFEGFVPDILVKNEPVQRQGREYINGELYEVIEVIYPLYPLKTGKFQIKGGSISVEFSDTSRRDIPQSPFWDFYDDFFPRRFQRKILTSPEIIVYVKGLPEKPGKEKFTGLVGKFAWNWAVSSTDVKEGETITLTLEVKGSGNFRNFAFPQNFEIPGFKTFTDKPQINVRMGGNSLEGEARLKVALIPIKEGVFRSDLINQYLPTYFDPEREDYLPLRINDFTIHVRKGEGKREVVSARGGEETGKMVETLTSDIFGIFSSPRALKKEILFPPFPIFISAFLSFPLIFLVTYLYKFMNERKKMRKEEFSRSKAFKLLKREIKEAVEPSSLLKVFLTYLSRKLSLESVTAEEALHKLENVLEVNEISQLREFFQKLEACAYGGDQQYGGEKLTERILLFAQMLEKKIKK